MAQLPYIPHTTNHLLMGGLFAPPANTTKRGIRNLERAAMDDNL